MKTPCENAIAMLHYDDFDAVPVVDFGFWDETVEKWIAEGKLKREELPENIGDRHYFVARCLGFDFSWETCFDTKNGLMPPFKTEIIEERPDGSYLERDGNGVVMMKKHGVTSIPVEVSHTLVDRESWEEHYLPRLQFTQERADFTAEQIAASGSRYNAAAPRLLHAGSLFGKIRDITGVVGYSYIMADDEELFAEIIDTFGDIAYKALKAVLDVYDRFDGIHFWEDICFKNGPLINPSVFEELVGPHYKKVTGLAREHGIDVASLDCDGCIDKLVPIWLENGVNTMFPIEVGVWNASIAPWREQYGRELKGVGGMDKRVFAHDKAAVDAEIERLRPLIELGGYIPCPDHRIAPDAKYELVQYYCDRMHSLKI